METTHSVAEGSGEVIDFIPATSGHIPLLNSIVSASITDMEKQDIYQWDTRYPAAEDFRRDISERTLFVIRYNGIACGCICINDTECPEYKGTVWKRDSFKVVHRLVVSPAAQGNGIGTAAMRYAERVACEQKRESIRLDAFAENPAALHLYRKLGYVVRGTAPFRMGLFYLFEKELW